MSPYITFDTHAAYTFTATDGLNYKLDYNKYNANTWSLVCLTKYSWTTSASTVFPFLDKYYGFDGNNIIVFHNYNQLRDIYYDIRNQEYIVDNTNQIVRLNNCPITLPTGVSNQVLTQPTQSIYSAWVTADPGYHREYVAKMKTQMSPYKCECGGHKTFQETNEHFKVNHSFWCQLVVQGIAK